MNSKYSYFWTYKSGYSLGTPDSTVYKTKDLAAQACSKTAGCTGYTNYSGKWKINKGSNVSKNTKAKTYVRGGYTKLRFTVVSTSKFTSFISTPLCHITLYYISITSPPLRSCLDCCFSLQVRLRLRRQDDKSRGCPRGLLHRLQM